MAEPGSDVGGITGWILDLVESLGALGRPRIDRALGTVPLLIEEDLRHGDERCDAHGAPSVLLRRLSAG